jgi:hypothetical protein
VTTPFIFPDPPWPSTGTDYGQCLSLFLRPVSLPMLDGSTYVANIFDLASNSAIVSGRQCLAEAIARRLVTTRGTLIDDPDYGFDLRGYVNDDIDARGLALIGAGVEAECLKDERVIAATAAVSLVAGVLVVAVSITDAKGPVKLVLSVSQVTVSILQVGA